LTPAGPPRPPKRPNIRESMTPGVPERISYRHLVSIGANMAASGSVAKALDKRVLVWGAYGWIGSQVVQAWPGSERGWESVVPAASRLEEIDACVAELDRVQPTHVVIAAGLTGRPTVDWCEDHKAETLAVNFAGTLLLANECSRRGLRCCILGSGCVFEHDEEHPNVADDHLGWKERDKPNFVGSFYSRTKAALETNLPLSSVLYLRIRMPVTGDGSPRCLLTKLAGYKGHVVDGLHNSITFLPDLVSAVPELLQTTRGILNFVQPNGLTHRQILTLALGDEAVKEYTFVTKEEGAALTKAPRSNCVLNTAELGLAMGQSKLKLRTAEECLRGLRKDT